MSDPIATVISGPDLMQFGAAYSHVSVVLPVEVRRQLAVVFKNYFAAYGMEEVYERFNGRTVAQILTEYQPHENSSALVVGEMDGVRYALYERTTDEAAEPPSMPTDLNKNEDPGTG